MGLFLLSILFSLTAKASECSMRQLLEANQNLLPKDQEVIEPVRGQGGFINPFYEEGPRNESGDIELPSQRRGRLLGSITPRPVEDVNQISREMKELFVREIAGPTSERTPAQELMIRRIQDMNIVFKNCNGVEGSNDSARYEISLCSNALKMPKLALVALIAHELGHALDLCGLGSKRYHKTDPSVNLAALSSGGSETFTETLSGMSDPANPFLLDTSFARSPQELAAFSGLAQRAGLEITDQGLPLSSNPLLHSYQCLGGVDPHYRPLPDTREEICNGTLFTESGAQIWAARMTGKFIESHPVSRAEALGLFANSMSGMQKGTTDKERDMDAIYFSDPNIRGLFGCTPTPKQNCLNEFRPHEDRSLSALIRNFNELEAPSVSCE